MKILVVGSGGREHALTWALSRSPQVTQLFNNSTNAGILNLAAPVAANSISDLTEFARKEKIDLTVIGPEQFLVDGIVDAFEAQGLGIFGPSKAAARLEGSKIFAKQFMQRNRIPTARAEFFDDAEKAQQAINQGRFDFPLVIKADGLAAGKGVVIAENEIVARETISSFMTEQKLGMAGTQILFEDCLIGRELSFLIFSDGENFLPMPFAQDHKRAFDNDQGPNTGGMGVISAPGMLDSETENRIINEIVIPSLAGAVREGFVFKGVMFLGLMLTASGPQLLEYNVRFGDPETQAVMRKLDSDLVEIFLASIEGKLDCIKPKWSDDAVSCVVMASAGYPGSYQIGKRITGIEVADGLNEVIVFQAGTKKTSDGLIETAGGRVLAATARAKTLSEATAIAYEGIGKINFEGAFYRKDIGRKN